MLELKFSKTSHAFQYPFQTAHGLKTHQEALKVEIGFRGFWGTGEAPAINYYNVTVDKMIEKLEHKKNFITHYAFTTPDRFWHFCHHLFPNIIDGDNFLICALDMAFWNLHANMKNQKLHQLWNIDWHNNTLTDYTIGIDRIEKMIEKMKAHPMPIYKIKLDESNAIDIIDALRKESTSVFRIDANASWSLDFTLQNQEKFKQLGVEFIEQPLAKDSWDDMKVLKEKSCLPYIADESCVTENDVEKCAEHFHGINIKLTKCGGITPALRMIKEAKKLEQKIMMGCMSESEIGTMAMMNFLPFLDYADIDGPLLLDLSLTKMKYEEGRMYFKD
ncbi:MAG: dipeptide epimerase [Chitinophagaceae bacterium]|nr:dipeptide epimerase [Chitinophagaceae bacterium]